MSKESIKTISLVCPSCGGNMKLSADGKKAVCPYCGHEMLVNEEEDTARKEYERRMAKARVDEDIKNLQIKNQAKRRLKGWLIALCVIAVICMINVLIPDSPMRRMVFPQSVDPFENVYLTYSGMSGDGRAELHFSGGNAAEYAEETDFEILPQANLSNGDTVTVKAKAPDGWKFEPSQKQFTVEGLTEWVLQTDQLNEENLNKIHANTERLIREDWEEILASSLAEEMSITPYRLYLFVAEDKNEYERNVLYDTYEVNVTRADGTVFTGYEACRYASLKIPADGVMTADYGTLMGFNFGFSHGFSYADSFSGWTDAAEMEADLRHARDGYRLVE